MQALGGGRWETIRSVILPGALPYIFSGMKVAAVLAVAIVTALIVKAAW